MAMKCIICDKKTAFTQNGWFGMLFPVCTEHYHICAAYGSGGTSFHIGKERIEAKFPQNIIHTFNNKK